MFRKIASLVYSAGAYVLFLGAFFYLIAFTNNLTPHSVSGEPSIPPLPAALVDIALITLFGFQHGIMARPGFKRRWTRIVPPHLERSTFVCVCGSPGYRHRQMLATDQGRSMERKRGRIRDRVCDLVTWIPGHSSGEFSH